MWLSVVFLQRNQHKDSNINRTSCVFIFVVLLFSFNIDVFGLWFEFLIDG